MTEYQSEIDTTNDAAISAGLPKSHAVTPVKKKFTVTLDMDSKVSRKITFHEICLRRASLESGDFCIR